MDRVRVGYVGWGFHFGVWNLDVDYVSVVLRLRKVAVLGFIRVALGGM